MLLPYACLVRVHALLNPISYLDDGQVCSETWNSFITAIFPSVLLQNILAILLVFLQAVMLNRLVIKHRITKAYTLFPGMFYILFSAVFVENLGLSIYTIANTFAIASLYSTFALYKKHKPEVALYRSGFWTGVAAMFSPIYWLLLIPNIYGFSSLRSFNFKEFFQIIAGIATAIIIAFSLTYYFNVTNFWNEITRLHFSSFNLEDLAPHLIFFVVLSVTLISVILMNSTFLLRKSLPSKKKITVLYTVLFTSLASIFLTCNGNPNVFYYLWLVLPIFVSMIVIHMKNLSIVELLHVLLLVLIFNTHFQFFQLF